jgi:hypothetical protein
MHPLTNPISNVFENQKSVDIRLLEVSKLLKIPYISLIDVLCNFQSCEVTFNDEFIYRDPGHLRRNLLPETITALIHHTNLTSSLEKAVKGSVRD